MNRLLMLYCSERSTPTDNTTDDTQVSFHKEQERMFGNFPKEVPMTKWV
jgi:hypothetical protein